MHESARACPHQVKLFAQAVQAKSSCFIGLPPPDVLLKVLMEEVEATWLSKLILKMYPMNTWTIIANWP